MIGVPGEEPLERRDHGGKSALHVGGAAPVQQSVLHHRYEWIRLPLLERSGRDDIGMSGETEHRAAGSVPCPEIIDCAERHALELEREWCEPARDQVEAASILGTDGVQPNQGFGKSERVGHLDRSGAGVARAGRYTGGFAAPQAARGDAAHPTIAMTRMPR